LQPFGDLCEVDAVLCTRLEEANGTFTGKILGNNCRGDEKVARVREWMSTSGLPAEALMYAYGDSSGDTALLAAAKNGYLVTKMDDAEEFA
jgi:HAD superfamily phosphoserine phosphatase-like hydrolase